MGPSLPCGHSLRKGRKDWLTEPWRVSGGWCEPGGWVAAWLEAAVGLSQSLSSGPAPHSTHSSVPVGWSRQHVANGRSGAGEVLGLSKAASALGGWDSLGLGAAGDRAGGCLSPHRLPGPPRLCTVQTCLKLLPVAFALVSELQLCNSQPFLCPTITASAPQTLGQHILLLGGL